MSCAGHTGHSILWVKSNHTCTGRWTHPPVCLVWDKIVVISFFVVGLTMRLVASVLASEKPSSSVFFNRTLPQPTPYWTIVTYVTIIASSQSPRVTSSSPHCVDTICGDTFVKMIKTFVIVKWSLRKRQAIVGFLALACYDAICELVFVGENWHITVELHARIWNFFGLTKNLMKPKVIFTLLLGGLVAP